MKTLLATLLVLGSSVAYAGEPIQMLGTKIKPAYKGGVYGEHAVKFKASPEDAARISNEIIKESADIHVTLKGKASTERVRQPVAVRLSQNPLTKTYTLTMKPIYAGNISSIHNAALQHLTKKTIDLLSGSASPEATDGN
jgi:hypothetical protein